MNFVYCLFGEEHAQYAAKSAWTLLKNYPHEDYVFFVDQHYEVLRGLGKQLIRPENFRHPFMVANVLCQLELLYMMPRDDSELTFFLDTDVLHCKELDIDKLGEMNADIYPTYRRNMGKLGEMQPYNYGVLIVRHTVASMHAMSWMLQRVMKLHPRHQQWYGNQIALRELCGPLNVSGKTYTRPMGYFDLRVAQLPCDQWNWSPHKKRVRAEPGWGNTKHFIHLKGSLKKHHFDWYYDKVMGEAETADA